MSRLRIYGDQSGYLDLVAPDSASNQVINLDGLINADSNGNVGIGTLSPSAKLHVSSDITSNQTAGNSIGFGTYNGGFTFDGVTVADYGLTYTQPTGEFNSVVSGFSNIKFTAGRAERMRIVSNGKVGIGTSSPTKTLHVYRNDTDTSAQVLIEQAGTGDASIGFLRTGVYNWMTGIDNTDNKYKISGSGEGLDTNNYLAIDTSGNVGIGTSSPGSKLDVNGTTTLQGSVYLNRTSVLTDAAGNNYGVSNTGAIGTTSHVVAGQGSGAVGLSLNDGGGNASVTFNHHLRTPDVTGNSLRISTNVDGNVGNANMTFEGKSYTTAGTAVSLTLMAQMFADTGNMTIGGSLTQNSDLRIKKDLQIIPDALDKVKTLNGYTYTRTDRDSEFQQTGCVAQEVQAVLPEAVVTGEDEQQTLSIAYGSMVGLLVQAIKELEAKVAALEST